MKLDFNAKHYLTGGTQTKKVSQPLRGKIKISYMSAAAGLKSGQFNRIKYLTKYNFIFLTGLTGWTGYNQTEQKKSC